MKLIFLPVPGHGHVNPTLAVATELVERGHEVTYLLTEPFRGAVTATGARFALLDAPVMDGPPPPMPGGAAPFALLMDELLGVSEAAAEPLRELYDATAPGALVVESMSLWGRLLAIATGARTVALSPSYVMGADSPVTARMAAILGGSGPPPLDVERVGAAAARYGADPARLVGFPFGPPAPTVVVFMPADFHPGGDAMPPGVRFVGPMTTRAEPDGFDLGAMATEPGRFVSLGTVFNDRPQFWHDCLAALGDRPAVIAHGAGFDPAGLDVPPGVVLAPHVPQLRVLAHTSVFVTHGGMNSVMEAAAFGVPMVVVPQMVEQEVTADRVAELGMGVRLSPGDVTAETLAAAVARVEDDPSFRKAAAEMRAACAGAGGVAAAADAVEAAARA